VDGDFERGGEGMRDGERMIGNNRLGERFVGGAWELVEGGI